MMSGVLKRHDINKEKRQKEYIRLHQKFPVMTVLISILLMRLISILLYYLLHNICIWQIFIMAVACGTTENVKFLTPYFAVVSLFFK